MRACDTSRVANPRRLEDILAELSQVQDELLATASDDFATRASLSGRQDTLRQEASRARSTATDDMDADQLQRHVEHLEQEIVRHLESRPSSSAGAQTGLGGGIDPQYLHDMHRKMAKSFDLDGKKRELQLLKARLDELRKE